MLRIAACFFGGLIVLAVTRNAAMAMGATLGLLIGLALALWLTKEKR